MQRVYVFRPSFHFCTPPVGGWVPPSQVPVQVAEAPLVGRRRPPPPSSGGGGGGRQADQDETAATDPPHLLAMAPRLLPLTLKGEDQGVALLLYPAGFDVRKRGGNTLL